MRNEPEWVEWDNERDSLCPVPSGHDVEVRFLDGETSRDTNPEGWTWYNDPDHVTDSDIVAYRDWTVFNEHQGMVNQCWTTIRNQQAISEVVNEPEWIEWKCLDVECPVPHGNDVEVKLRDGCNLRDSEPQGWNWYNSEFYESEEDIIAYRDWTAFHQQQENKMNGQQFKQQRTHPASALAEQISEIYNQANEEHATVADLLDMLTRDQQLFALGYLTAKMDK